MNPNTVKQLLGDKSLIAMYRDCLKVVPLMNPNVTLINHFRAKRNIISKNTSDNRLKLNDTNQRLKCESSKWALFDCFQTSRYTRSKSNIWKTQANLIVKSMCTTQQTRKQRRRASRQRHLSQTRETCQYSELINGREESSLKDFDSNRTQLFSKTNPQTQTAKKLRVHQPIVDRYSRS